MHRLAKAAGPSRVSGVRIPVSPPIRPTRLKALAPLALLLLSSLCLTACIERKLFVRSEPEGASVFVDGTYRGETPLEVPFTTYGTRELTLRATGHRTLRGPIELTPPWYAVPGIDLVTEVLLPITIEDRREVFVQLGPSEAASAARGFAELTDRAEQVKSEAR